MKKTGTLIDEQRRYKRVDQLLDTHSIKDLPEADADWPTCLIIAPKTVVGNWVRELERVCATITRLRGPGLTRLSGVTLKSPFTTEHNVPTCLKASKWADMIFVSLRSHI